ncbi:hypothetical protein LAZ67_2005795 [Cordylochernes scorpioides]|uniref:Integrase catalytic domain-containing protein n=1 Tax=Cordylochernes scorpioides TaxID=51811 RepID=A0ABY6K4W0_9ARAC|nr:hypothetical protein LAZ67_2005795 [Cordylochernes scorpioides]
MSKDITQKVKTCPTCQLTKRPLGPTYGDLGQPPDAKGPFDLLSLDTIAGFAKYGNTKIYLHVVVDHFSRYTWTFPSKSTSITTYQQVLKRVLQDGSPKRLLMDRAPAFTSPKFKSFLLNRSIHPLLTTSNNPQANGLCERLNATLTGKLRLLHLENPKIAWTKLVKRVTTIYNSTPHSITGFPPIYLMFGVLPPELSDRTTPYPDIDRASHRKRRQFRKTDDFTRGMVIGLKGAGWSIRQIAADTHLGASTVHRLWRRWLEQGNVAIYRNVGATRVTSARVDRRILRQAVAAPQATCTAILQHVQDTLDHSISTRTISRRLGTMTAQRYVDDVLRPVTLPYLQDVPNALYQQDNARPHTARISQQALQDVQMLPWPPYSPDLSPIEHVWDIIGRRLHALPQPRSEDELWQMVEREWRAIPQDAIRTLIDSLPRRVAACIAVRGGPTCY